MKQYTPQYIMNVGYEVIAETEVNVDNLGIVSIPPVDGTNLIRVTQNGSAIQCFIGGSNMQAGGRFGLPLFTINIYFDGVSTPLGVATPYYSPVIIEYLTCKPELFYLTATGGSSVVVQYLTIIDL